MTSYVIAFLALSAGLLLGLLCGWYWFSKGKEISQKLLKEIGAAERELDQLQIKVTEAKNAIKTAEHEAKATTREILSEAKVQASEIEAKIETEQVSLEEKEKHLDEKVTEVERQRSVLQQKEDAVETLRKELADDAAQHRTALESVAKLSQEEAKKQLKDELTNEFSDFFAGQVKQLKEKAKEEYEDAARSLMVEAIHRYAAEVASESTATIVQIPSDDVKGKIIGKEGRNITAFEQLTGVDVIIDDTPGAIILSGFDLARRYVAKLAIEKLIKDGRIQPARIEEIVVKMKEHVGKMMLEFGKRATDELGITGYSQDFLKIIGRLRFRTSYGQNILKHSGEMAHLGRMIAEEIGADVMTVEIGRAS